MEETKLVRLSKLLESKEPIGEVTVEAMMENLKEGGTSNGQKYVSGEFTDHNYRIEFKVWKTSLDGFLKRYNLEKDHAYVVQATGSYEFSMVLRSLRSEEALQSLKMKKSERILGYCTNRYQ